MNEMPAKRSRPAKSERIAFRLTPTLRSRLDVAMAITGQDQTSLITEAIAERTNAIIREQRFLELSQRDVEALEVAIANPPAPNEALLRSVARWRDRGAPV